MWQVLAHALVRLPDVSKPGGVQVIIGRLTESAAVVMATKLEQELPALFVGEATASRPNFFNDHRPWPDREIYRVPGTHIRLRVSRIQEQWSAPQDRRKTLLADVAVELSWEHFANGVDSALNAARTISNEQTEAFFVTPEGEPLVEPWSHPWRKPQRPAWIAAADVDR